MWEEKGFLFVFALGFTFIVLESNYKKCCEYETFKIFNKELVVKGLWKSSLR